MKVLINLKNSLFVAAAASIAFTACKPGKAVESVDGDAAQKVYVAPGKYDELYMFASGGFSGQVAAYGLPSGRLLKVIPVFFSESGKRLRLF